MVYEQLTAILTALQLKCVYIKAMTDCLHMAAMEIYVLEILYWVKGAAVICFNARTEII